MELRPLHTSNMPGKMPPNPLGPVSYAVLRGEPLLIQVRLDPSSHEEPPSYAYAALVATAHAADGSVTGGDIWPLGCGPPPGPGDPNYGLQDEQGSVTNHPLPGP